MKENPEAGGFLRSRWGIGAVAFVAIAALLLVFEHWTHIGGSSIISGMLLLVCIGMHLLMHAGHGAHGGHGRGGSNE